MADPRIALGLLLICGVLAATNASPQGRILGGEDAAQGEYPWTVSVRVNKAHACSGSIIGTNRILTAASCVSSVATTPVDPSSVAVRVGSINQYAGGTIVPVKSILIHPSYGNFLHNLAILFLDQNLTFTDRIAAVTLPEVEETEAEVEELPNGTPVYVAGWGELSDGTASYKLQKANYNTLSAPWCELSAGYGYEHVVCVSSAEKEGICRGDAGAAVVDDKDILRGVTSFHFGECGSKFPDITTRVSYYLAWIEANAS